MNLNELRLKALLSLKRPLPTPSEEPVMTNIEAPPSAVPETTLKSEEVQERDREEGELTDYSASETSSSPTESEEYPGKYENYEFTEHNHKKHNYSRNYTKAFKGPSNKKPKYTWTRHNQNDFHEDSDSHNDKSLENLKEMKSNLLYQLDETQALLAASEDHEQELAVEIEECRNLQRKCESERSKLEKQLEKLLKSIAKRESIED